MLTGFSGKCSCPAGEVERPRTTQPCPWPLNLGFERAKLRPSNRIDRLADQRKVQPCISTFVSSASGLAVNSLIKDPLALDHGDFGSHRSKIMNVIDFKSF